MSTQTSPTDGQCPPATQSHTPGWLAWLILAGLLVGGGIGQLLYWQYNAQVPTPWIEAFDFIGNTFFMNLLKMVLVPLVTCSVILGVTSIGTPGQLGRLGGQTVGFYFATMLIATTLGVLLVTAFEPGDPGGDGKGIGQTVISQGSATYSKETPELRQTLDTNSKVGDQGMIGALWMTAKNLATQMLPSNPIAAAARADILPLITVSLLLGVVLSLLGEAGRPLLAVIESLYAAVMKLVEWFLYLAPLGVTCLVASTVARLGAADLLLPLAEYAFVVVLGLGLHAVVVLPALLWALGRTNPFRFMHQMRQSVMTAFGTASSNATLPVTLDDAVVRGGCSKKTAHFVIPLGATINMDGTALYEAVAVVFLFQCYGIPLGPTELTIVVVTATLSAVGAAGIPSAGLVTMAIVVQAVNGSLPPDKALPLSAVGIILGIDRVLDMCRTAVNVWGDAVAARVLSRWHPDEPCIPIPANPDPPATPDSP